MEYNTVGALATWSAGTGNCSVSDAGCRHRRHNGLGCQLPALETYVSVEATLRNLLVNPQYAAYWCVIITDKYIPGRISHCWDDFPCKCHPVLGDASKFGIAIQLFFDGVGTTNPLHGQSSMYTVGVFWTCWHTVFFCIYYRHGNMYAEVNY